MDNLSQGSTGPAVKNLQVLLNFHLRGVASAALVPDAIFGSKTREAVILFQKLNKILVDGIVGPQTTAVLLSARSVSSQVAMTPNDDYDSRSLAPVAQRAQFRKGGQMKRLLNSPFLLASNDDTAPPVTQQAPPPAVVETTVVVQTGQQVNINPWFFSPFVATVQGNILIKQDGRTPFLISPGVQLFFNQLGAPNGPWSGQAFIQMGPSEIFSKNSPVLNQLVNPFVQAFVQVNAQGPAGVGFAIGNQANYNLLGDKLTLFVNAQAVSTTDLSRGMTSAPSGQILGGVGIDIFQLLGKK